MTQSRVVRVFTAAAAAFVLFALTGCANKVTTPDAGFSSLEGVQSNQMLLVGYQQPALTESHWLVATTENATPFYSASTPVAGDSTGRLFGMVFDHTIADGLQLYRNSDGSGLVPVYDYTLRPFLKFLPDYRDVFQFEDANATGAATRYVVRGTLNGRASHESPISNEALATGVFDETMLETTANRFLDSTGTFAWTADPRAVLYIVDIMDWGEVSANKTSAVRCAYPTPVYPDPTVAQTVLLTTDLSVHFDLRGQRFPIRKLVRVAAVDENFRIVNRLNPAMRNLNTVPPTSIDAYKFRFTEEAPANFNAFSVLPMGGVKVVFDPFNQDIGAPNRAGDALRSAPATAANGAARHGVTTKGLTPAQAVALVEKKRAERFATR